MRAIEYNNGAVNAFQLGGFVGVEYYILPKICIGGEYSLMYKTSWGSQSNAKYNEWAGDSYNFV